MIVFEAERPQENYVRQLDTLMVKGDRVEVRGRTTLELLDCATVLTRPTDPCILIPGRRWNPWIALSEGLWILAGRNDVASLLPYNHNITEFSDDGKTLYGAYGLRIYHQMNDVVERLRNDPSDRRAVLQIWDNNWVRYGEGHDDLTSDSKDPPCNNLVYFKVRQGQLHMTVINRSNDLHWGLYAVNTPTFQMIQQYIAARLEVAVGNQTHVSNSLHIYIDDSRARTITQNMIADMECQAYPEHSLMWPISLARYNHLDMAEACNRALAGEPLPAGFDDGGFVLFAGLMLEMYRARDWRPEYLDPSFADWIQAGTNFVDKVWKKGY